MIRSSQKAVAIVLGAGLSSRMGRLKQLLPIDGEPALRLIVRRLASRLDRVIVVLGHQAEQVRAALAGLEVEIAVNPAYASGMTSSVQCGVEAAGEAPGYLVCLGDQPSLSPSIIELISARAQSAKQGLIIPTYGGKRGHPIFIRRAYRERILALGPDEGLNKITRGYPADTLEVEVADEAILDDMDTPADYQREVDRSKRV